MSDEQGADFDFVVVGGGSAGCVVAARLSEDPNCSVLLLEAGGENTHPDISIPGKTGELWQGESSWPSPTQPQRDVGSRIVPLLTGTGLGGGSSINAMGWFHGQPGDYERWVSAGATGWGWQDVLPVLRSIEDHELGVSEHHGSGGPIAVGAPSHVHPLALAVVEAGLELGWPLSGDFNATQRTGVSLAPSNIRAGKRHSVVDGYLTPARSRANLSVKVGCRVQRVEFEGERAVGVSCVTASDLHSASFVRARRGVVLTAGALRTPQLLMLSGIGPADELRQHGIAVVADVPGVGRGLQDHPAVMLPFAVGDKVRGDGRLYDEPDIAYRLLRRGPLSALGQSVALVASGSRAIDPSALPEIVIGLSLLGREQGLAAVGPSTAVFAIGLVDPESVGTVRIASSRLDDAPLVDPCYLHAPADRPRLRDGVRKGLQLLASRTLRDHVELLVESPLETDEQIDDYTDKTLATFFHPVGTARMGSDAQAVVSPKLQVRGVSGLWVADASVMPRIVRGLTQAPTIVIAERAAGFITAANP
jgi:choline dehydrogenase